MLLVSMFDSLIITLCKFTAKLRCVCSHNLWCSYVCVDVCACIQPPLASYTLPSVSLRWSVSCSLCRRIVQVHCTAGLPGWGVCVRVSEVCVSTNFPSPPFYCLPSSSCQPLPLPSPPPPSYCLPSSSCQPLPLPSPSLLLPPIQ